MCLFLLLLEYCAMCHNHIIIILYWNRPLSTEHKIQTENFADDMYTIWLYSKIGMNSIDQ